MSGEENWKELRLELDRETRAIHRHFAVLVLPFLLIAMAFGVAQLKSSEGRQQLAAQTLHIDRH
jgi:hypothetical protein